MNRPRENSFFRRLRASARDPRLLVRQFTWSLEFLTVAVGGGGLFYYVLVESVGEPVVL